MITGQYKQLEPIIAKPGIEQPIDRKTLAFFYYTLFDPLIKQFKQINPDLYNSVDRDLLNAILDHKIEYADGKFAGIFNAKISKALKALGGYYDQFKNGFKLEQAKLPLDLQIAIAQARHNKNDLHANLLNKLDSIDVTKALEAASFEEEYMQAINSTDSQFEDTVGVDIHLLPEEKDRIAKEYSTNMKLYINDFCDEEILTLRALVEQNMFEGSRIEDLAIIIQNRYGVSENKAKFLARQETNLLTAKYKEVRYAAAGIEQYKWSTSGKSNVRHDHAILNGKTFAFKSPPIVNQATGKRGNPGEDYNCYCVAIPLQPNYKQR